MQKMEQKRSAQTLPYKSFDPNIPYQKSRIEPTTPTPTSIPSPPLYIY